MPILAVAIDKLKYQGGGFSSTFFFVAYRLDYLTMEQSAEEISAIQHDVIFPVNLSQKSLSSDDCENIASAELKNGELNAELNNHAGSIADTSEQEKEDHFINQPAEEKAEKLSVSEESDYEEPKKMSETSSPIIDETLPADLKETQSSLLETSENLIFSSQGKIDDDAKPVEGDELEKEEVQECMKCLKCGELINLAENKINDFSPSPLHFHVNCFRCAHCDSPISDENYQVNEGKPFCKFHCDNPSSGQTPKEEEILAPTLKHEDEKLELESPRSVEEEEEKEIKSNGQELQHEEETPSADILPPTGSAKRLVEQWSNIEALKIGQSVANSTQSDSAPKYPPNTARSIAAKFSAGVTEEQQSPKPRTSIEPSEHLPSQGQARGLIAKFSAMHA
nr:Zinc finger LIM type [Hymenolepis microstoma]